METATTYDDANAGRWGGQLLGLRSQYLLGGTGWARFTLPDDHKRRQLKPTPVESAALPNSDAGLDATAGSPTASITPQAIDINSDASFTATAGSPTFSITAGSVAMAEQTIQLLGSWGVDNVFGRGWSPPGGSFPQIDAALTEGSNRFISNFYVNSSGRFRLFIEPANFQANIRADLSGLFESSGSLELNVGLSSWLFELAGVDTEEPYSFTPNNVDDAIALYDALESVDIAGTLVIRDFVPAAPAFADDTDASLSAYAGSPTATITPESVAVTNSDAGLDATAGSPTATIEPETVDINSDASLSARAGNTTVAITAESSVVDNNDASLSATAGNPTSAITPDSDRLLVLADSDDTGLEVDCKALLVASAPGLSGSNFYVDSDRGGSDTPLDGELGLGATETVISRFRRFSATTVNLNDNNNPAALDIGPYFDVGGDGNDLTLYLQTLNDGEVSFTAAAQYSVGGGNFARFNIPDDAQTLLDNLETDDRWIFKAARPVAVTNSDASFGANAGDPTASITAESVDINSDASFDATAGLPAVTITPDESVVESTDASFDATAGNPTFSVTPEAAIVGVAESDASFNASGGIPTATITPESAAVAANDASLSATAGNPYATIMAESVDINIDASLSARAGNPYASFTPESIDLSATDASLSATAGIPTADIVAESVDINSDASFSASAGDPTATITPESDNVANTDASFSARAGSPTASFTPESESPDQTLIELDVDELVEVEAGVYIVPVAEGTYEAEPEAGTYEAEPEAGTYEAEVEAGTYEVTA